MSGWIHDAYWPVRHFNDREAMRDEIVALTWPDFPGNWHGVVSEDKAEVFKLEADKQHYVRVYLREVEGFGWFAGSSGNFALGGWGSPMSGFRVPHDCQLTVECLWDKPGEDRELLSRTYTNLMKVAGEFNAYLTREDALCDELHSAYRYFYREAEEYGSAGERSRRMCRQLVEQIRKQFILMGRAVPAPPEIRTPHRAPEPAFTLTGGSMLPEPVEAAEDEDDDLYGEDADDGEDPWLCTACTADLHGFDDGLLTETECGAFCPDCWDTHADVCEDCGAVRAESAAEDEDPTEEELAANRKEYQRRMESNALCACGHKERDHFNTQERACHWSTGSGKNYRDCDCNGFTPAIAALPLPERDDVIPCYAYGCAKPTVNGSSWCADHAEPEPEPLSLTPDERVDAFLNRSRCIGCQKVLRKRREDRSVETPCGTVCDALCVKLHERRCTTHKCAEAFAAAAERLRLDTLPSLPGLGDVQADRAAAAAEAEGESLTLDLLTPSPSITATTGQMEIHSPLFRGSSANPQLSLF